ncbi:hypothetical protein D3C85_1506650 [compost metagenome]
MRLMSEATCESRATRSRSAFSERSRASSWSATWSAWFFAVRRLTMRRSYSAVPSSCTGEKSQPSKACSSVMSPAIVGESAAIARWTIARMSFMSLRAASSASMRSRRSASARRSSSVRST